MLAKQAENVDGGDKVAFAGGRQEAGERAGGQEIDSPEMGVAPPDTLPPSPPLTEIDGRDEDESKQTPDHSSKTATHLAEEDITNWQASVDGRDASYHESDLGYSTGNEVTPIDGRAPSTRLGGMGHDREDDSSAAQEVLHPLRFDVHPPSPPLWEVIQPPETNNAGPTQGALSPRNVARGERIPKAAYVHFVPASICSTLKFAMQDDSSVNSFLVLLFRSTAFGCCIRNQPCRSHWRSPSSRDHSCRAGLFRRRTGAVRTNISARVGRTGMSMSVSLR